MDENVAQRQVASWNRSLKMCHKNKPNSNISSFPGNSFGPNNYFSLTHLTNHFISLSMKLNQFKTTPKFKSYFLRPAIIVASSFLSCFGNSAYCIEFHATSPICLMQVEVLLKEHQSGLRPTCSSKFKAVGRKMCSLGSCGSA